MHSPCHNLALAVVLIASGATALPALAQARIMAIDELSGGEYASEAFGVSGDGTVVAGRSRPDVWTYTDQAFRWSEDEGIIEIPRGGARQFLVFGISGDGRVIVGDLLHTPGGEATYWTADSGLVRIGEFPGGTYYSRAEATNADGTVIVGHSTSENGWESFRWSEDRGMLSLGDLPGGAFDSRAYGVSHDGSVVVGRCDWGSNREAYRWTDATGMVGLGDLPGGRLWSAASDTNKDGSVVVGRGTEWIIDRPYDIAFRWTEADGMVSLGDLPGFTFSSGANAVNADGTVVVGFGTSFTGREPMVWTPDDGMRSVWDMLVAEGVDPADDGWDFLLEATDVSDDGSVIVGFGNRRGQLEAFYAVLPELSTGCYADFDTDGNLTIFDFLGFQNAFDSGDSAADCDADGSLTLFDFLCFQNAFDAGCP